MLDTPPLNALAAFEAAARTGSFTRAGEELCVTQAAISQHVRHLEEYLGLPLFIRHAPGIRLTPDGERFYRAVAGALDTLRRESARLRRGGGQLAVVAEASFANRWLAPRLSRFCERFPEIDLRIAPHPGRPRLGPDVDIIIHPDMQPSSGLFMLPLPEERMFPVFAPSYFQLRGETWKSDRLLRSPPGKTPSCISAPCTSLPTWRWPLRRTAEERLWAVPCLWRRISVTGALSPRFLLPLPSAGVTLRPVRKKPDVRPA